MNSLENAIMALLELEPFYGYLLVNMNKVIDETLPAPAGISITDTVNLYINPKYFNEADVQMRIAYLKHECDHVIFDHVDRFHALSGAKEDQMMHNIAADMVVNQLNKYGQSDATIDAINKAFNLTLPYGMHSEFYYAELKKIRDDIQDKEPDHSSWGKSSKNEIIRKTTLIQTLEKSADDTRKGAGQIPDNVLKTINELKAHKINWKTQLRRFVNVATEVLRESSRRKINRRYEYANPGIKYDQRLKLVVVSDTSGSTWSYQNDFFKEIEAIHKTGVDITVIECDTQVQAVYEFKPKATYEVRGAGGTLYNPAFEKAKELKPDAVIFFGDGDCFDERVVKPKCPVLWVMVNQNKPPVTWGSLVNLEVV